MNLHLDHDYVLNPDGSGKVALRWEGDSPSPELQAPQFIGSEVMKGKGIDAWGDLACTLEDGKLKFTATAYFKKIAELRFHCQGFHASTLDFIASTDEKGNFVLKNPVAGPGPSEPSSASDDELRARLEGEREKFAQAREFFVGMIGGLVCTASIRLPGAVGKVRHGKKSRPDTVSVRFEGKTIVDLLDRLMSDDELALKLLRSGKEGPEALFDLVGDQGPMEVVTTGKLAPLMDYEAESAAARENFAALAEKLDLPKPPAVGPPLGNARIVAAKVVREADSDRELHPMGQNYTSMHLTVVGDLPDGVLKVDEGRMDAAITDAGENLVPDDDWKRRISFPHLTKDRRTAFFDIELPVPTPGVEGFREIRGLLMVQVSSGSEEVDLGFKKLEQGAAGKEFGALIEQFEPEDERTRIDLKLHLATEAIESITLVGAKGEEVPMSQMGSSSSGDECVLTYSIEGAIPKKVKLVARVAKNLQRIDVPFDLRNVDLLGRSRK
jgi:hypothetical protein